MLPGERIGGRYRLEEGPILGGRGEVWVAEDTVLGRRVALKRAQFTDSRLSTFEQVQGEARAMAKFNHPHLVTIHDAVRVPGPDGEGPGGDEAWLVMEYASGGSLADRPPMTPVQAARIGVQIAGALAALHTARIVHCDVKPGNVLLTEDGTAKLTDLDAVYRLGGDETLSPTRPGYTPDYAAREVVRGQPTHTSDVFSLGATLHALVTGRPPRDGAEGDADTEEIKDISTFRAAHGAVRLDPGLGPLEEPLARMLHPDPARRPDAEAARELLAVAAGAARPPGRLRTGWSRLRGLPRPARRRLAVGACLVVALAVVVPLAPWDLGTDGDPSPSPTGPGAPPATGVRASLGDQRTADPCALAEPQRLDQYGASALDRDYGSFDRCDVLLSAGSDEYVQVKLDLNTGPQPDPEEIVRRVGGVRIVEHPRETDECYRTLLLDGEPNANVTVTAKSLDDRAAPLCEIADTATASAVRVLNRGVLPRRRTPFPPASLAHQDACTLIDTGTLTTVAGLASTPRDVGFGNWSCDWGSDTEDLGVSLVFDRDLRGNVGDEGRATEYHGHRAYLLAEGDGQDTCVVQVLHRQYTDQNGDPAVEMLRFEVRGARPTDGLCRIAGDLAGAAAAELPSAAGDRV